MWRSGLFGRGVTRSVIANISCNTICPTELWVLNALLRCWLYDCPYNGLRIGCTIVFGNCSSPADGKTTQLSVRPFTLGEISTGAFQPRLVCRLCRSLLPCRGRPSERRHLASPAAVPPPPVRGLLSILPRRGPRVLLISKYVIPWCPLASLFVCNY